MTHTALVLGGGGITGIAWELGILKGLADAGVDLTGADVVVGTSAGSVVGAQITSGHTLDDLYADPARAGRRRDRGRTYPAACCCGWCRRCSSRAASSASSPGWARSPSRRTRPVARERIEVIRSRIEVEEWPDRDLRITAVEAENGEFVAFDQAQRRRHRGRRGRELRGTAGVAGGDDRAPALHRRRHALDRQRRRRARGRRGRRTRAAAALVQQAHLDQVAQLADIAPSRSAVVIPDAEALVEIGRNVLDPAKRADAARTGLRQAAAVLEKVGAPGPEARLGGGRAGGRLPGWSGWRFPGLRGAHIASSHTTRGVRRGKLGS